MVELAVGTFTFSNNKNMSAFMDNVFVLYHSIGK